MNKYISIPLNVFLVFILSSFLLIISLYFGLYLQECQIVELQNVLQELQVEVEAVKASITSLNAIYIEEKKRLMLFSSELATNKYIYMYHTFARSGFILFCAHWFLHATE
jgi:cell division protein FtsB